MRSNDFVPLRIRAYLRTPIISDNWCPIDGILLYQAFRDKFGFQETTVAGDVSYQEERDVHVPLKLVEGKYPYYQCSWAQWGPFCEGLEYWNKRFDFQLIAWMEEVKRIDVSSASYKNYRVPVYYRFALWIDWYAVGNIDKIKYLLSTCTHIGKKTSQGWGRVYKWEVESIEHDYSIIKNGVLMRGIPESEAPQEILKSNLPRAQYGFRPPYWISKNQTILIMPNNNMSV